MGKTTEGISKGDEPFLRVGGWAMGRGAMVLAAGLLPMLAQAQVVENYAIPPNVSPTLPWLTTWLVAQLALGIGGTLVIAWGLLRRNGSAVGRVAGAVGWLLLFLCLFKVPGKLGITGVGLDPSWPLVVEDALQHGWQWGKDVIYTMGPLGAFFSDAGLGGLSHERVLFAWSAALLMAYAFWRCGQMLPWCLRAAFWGWIILFTPSPVVLCAAVAVILMTPPENRWAGLWETIALPAGCALLALVKFTDLTAAVAALGFFGIRELVQRRWTRPAVVLVSFGGCFLLGWSAAGQSLMNLPAYLRNSAEISVGFHTMSQPASTLVLGWGLAIAAALLGTAATAPVLRMLPVLCCAFLSWKHGYTRADGHVTLFLCNAFLYACLMAATPRTTGESERCWSRWGAGAALLTLALSLGALNTAHLGVFREEAAVLRWKFGFHVDAPWSSPVPASPVQQTAPEELARWQLPLVRQTVKQASVDVFNYQQGYAFLNGLNYQPRPVFQSFSSYTPQLQRLNLASYLTASAPEFLLFRPETIDGRLVWLDDAPLLRHVMESYAPAGREKGFLLLKKILPAEKTADTWTEVYAGEAKWGHTLKLPVGAGQELYALRVTAPRSLLGMAKRMVYQPANAHITLKLDDGSKVTRLFIPEMAEEGFLLSPWMENVDDVLGWMTGLAQPRRVVAVSLEPWSGGEREFTSHYFYTLLKGPERPRKDFSGLAPLLYPYLPGVPEVIRPSVEVRMFNDQEACCARAPTRLEFSVPSSANGIEGRFAVECAPGATAENVTCRAVLLDAATNQELGREEHVLCPQLRPGDAGEHFLDFTFPVTAQANAELGKRRLVLESTTDAAHNRALTWWGPIHWKGAGR